MSDEDIEMYKEAFGFRLPNQLWTRQRRQIRHFAHSADLTIMAVQFLEDALHNLSFRIYFRLAACGAVGWIQFAVCWIKALDGSPPAKPVR